MTKEQARQHVRDFWLVTLGWDEPPDDESFIQNLFTLEKIGDVLGYLDESPSSDELAAGLRAAKAELGSGAALDILFHVLVKAGCLHEGRVCVQRDSIVTFTGKSIYFALRVADLRAWRKELHAGIVAKGN